MQYTAEQAHLYLLCYTGNCKVVAVSIELYAAQTDIIK